VSTLVKSASKTSRSVVVAIALVSLAGVVFESRLAFAQDRAGDRGNSIVPPNPAMRRAVRGVDVRLVLPFPVYAKPLCPNPAPCIVGIGGGVAVFLERRFQSGFALGGGYEVGLYAAEAVYELTTLQSLGARGRWIMRPESSGHPVFEVGLGAIALGNVFSIASGGPYLDLGFGGELEMTESLAFAIGFRVRTMMFVPFTSQPDGVERSVSPYVDVLVALHAGITWIAPRVRGR